MGLFRKLLRCGPNVTVNFNMKQATLNECDMAENIDVIFGSIILLSVVLSTFLNPLMIILKITERTLIGQLYAYLGMLYFLSNIERGPMTIYKLFSKYYEEQLRSPPNAYQLFAQTLYGFTTQNQQFILLLISSTRFLKCYRPFREINRKLVIASVIIFNIYSVALTFARWNQKRTLVYFSWSQSIIFSPGKLQYSYATILWMVVSFTTTVISCVFSLATMRVLERAPNLTRQSRATKRRATIVIGLLSLVDCLLAVLNLLTMTTFILDASRLTFITCLFFHAVMSYSIMAGVNPILILLTGYSGREVLDKLKIRHR